MFQFFLRLFARIVERAAENLALRLESKVLVLVCVEDVTDSRVNLNDVTSGVDDVRDPGGAVSGRDVAGDGISSAEEQRMRGLFGLNIRLASNTAAAAGLLHDMAPSMNRSCVRELSSGESLFKPPPCSWPRLALALAFSVSVVEVLVV